MTFVENKSQSSANPIRVIQLYEEIELYVAGEPVQNTLFILGPKNEPSTTSPIYFALEETDQALQVTDELLLIDPPQDAVTRFRLEGQLATVYTSSSGSQSANLPILETRPGGVAHIKIGQHFLDLYCQLGHTVVHLPAIGVICSGEFGSDVALPLLADGSDGEDELDSLRLLASLAKSTHFQLIIPRFGSLETDSLRAMRRLADDVSYIHALRRIISTAKADNANLATVLSLCDSVLPTARADDNCEERHLLNVQTLYLSP